MDLYSGDAVLDDHLPPLPVDVFCIHEQGEATFDDMGISFHFLYGEAETIALCRTRGSVSERGHILQGMSRKHASLPKGLDCLPHQAILRMISLGQPEKDVAIG